jgi:type VI protein secretion system component VasK
MTLSPDQQELKSLAITADKTALIEKTVQASNGLRSALAAASDALTALQARGYVKGAEEAISAENLLNKQFTADEFHEVVELFAELRKFSVGAAVKTHQWGLVNAKVAS